MRRIEPWNLRTGRAGVIGLGLLCVLTNLAVAQSESWDAVFIGGSKVGSMRTRVEPLKDKDRSLIRVLLNFDLKVRRGNDSASMEMEYGTIETPEGEVLRLDTRTYVSRQMIRVHGDVINGKMVLKIQNGDQRQEQVIDWSPDVRGPYGAELSFVRAPMKSDEVRTLKTFVPELNKIVAATLTARAVENIVLGGGVTRELLKVDQTVATLDGTLMPEMTQTFWVDSVGQVLKSYNENFGGTTTYRTTKEAATRPVARSEQLDLINGMVVKLGRKITTPENSREIVYNVSVGDLDPAEFFPNDRRQTLASKTLTVRTAGPPVGTAGPETVGDEYLRPNPLVNSDDFQVVRLARKAVAAATDPWAKAQAITHWVAANMKDKNFETSFAPADEVARNLTGDCTEHAVLTAAMCRAEGIPARVVVGLVYANQLGGFGYHMWNEVYVNRRWVAVDAAFDQTDVDAVHLKLSETSLDGTSPFETFTAVARVATRLKIEAVEVR